MRFSGKKNPHQNDYGKICRKQSADRANRVGLEVQQFSGTVSKNQRRFFFEAKAMKTIQFLVCVFFFEGHLFGGWRYFSAELHVEERKSPWESHFF